MPIPTIAEDAIHSNASPQSIARGETYYQNGAVGALTLRGSTLQAEVKGNEPAPYRVRLSFEDRSLTAVTCTCPYNFEGWCKHAVATLLVCLRQPQKIAERPTLERLLDRINHQQTQLLLQNLVAKQPELLTHSPD